MFYDLGAVANPAVTCEWGVMHMEQFRAQVSAELQQTALRASAAETLARIYAAEDVILTLPQVEIATEHVFHAGMYARTIRLQAGVVMTGALMKIATILIFNGLADVLAGEEWTRLGGYVVLAGDAFRKQVFVTRSAVEMTMVFPTEARTVDEAEREFTDEFERLMSRHDVTGG